MWRFEFIRIRVSCVDHRDRHRHQECSGRHSKMMSAAGWSRMSRDSIGAG